MIGSVGETTLVKHVENDASQNDILEEENQAISSQFGKAKSSITQLDVR